MVHDSWQIHRSLTILVASKRSCEKGAFRTQINIGRRRVATPREIGIGAPVIADARPGAPRLDVRLAGHSRLSRRYFRVRFQPSSPIFAPFANAGRQLEQPLDHDAPPVNRAQQSASIAQTIRNFFLIHAQILIYSHR